MSGTTDRSPKPHPQQLDAVDVAKKDRLTQWAVAHLRGAQVLTGGAPHRQEVYAWLFKTRNKDGQNRRILSLLELDAFAEIARSWQKLGYPFERLVPSYATSLAARVTAPPPSPS